MPTIFIKTPAGALSAQQRERMLTAVDAAATQCSGLGPDPRQRRLCWVIAEEIPAGLWRCGGSDDFSQFVPCLVQILAPAGVLDDAHRARYAAAVHQAIVDIAPVPEAQRLVTSIIVSDVEDGTWGANGQLWRLPQFVAAAGYAHMPQVVPSSTP
ncbi:tautomerase [Pseudomonas sp. MWU15-20650]|uniref:tautomerase family protein n=1 Tax=Pseudomonas sp. MWU15-20650 TaxID=2933107 RepID=UPI00200C6E1A|nr:tautomerase [Pseudomonas sp. MWU15-20650]